jgi:hypothetical protein
MQDLIWVNVVEAVEQLLHDLFDFTQTEFDIHIWEQSSLEWWWAHI